MIATTISRRAVRTVIQVINRTEQSGTRVERFDVLESMVCLSKQPGLKLITNAAAEFAKFLPGVRGLESALQQIVAGYLTDSCEWRDAFVEYFALPSIADRIRAGRPLPKVLMHHLDRPPFDGAMRLKHVRDLAAMLSVSGPMTALQIARVFRLTGFMGLKQFRRSLLMRLRSPNCVAYRRIVSEAMIHCGTPFMIPYLLSRILRTEDCRIASGPLLALLTSMRPLIFAHGDGKPMQQLRTMVATALTQGVSATEPLMSSSLMPHLQRFGDYRDNLGLGSSVSLEVGEWLQMVAAVIDHSKLSNIHELRRLWIQEVRAVLAGSIWGASIIPGLFRAVFESGTVSEVDLAAVTCLLKRVRSFLGFTRNHLQSLLEPELNVISRLSANDPLKTATACCAYQKIVGAAVPDHVRRQLLVEILHGQGRAHPGNTELFLRAITAWSSSPNSRERNVARVARSILNLIVTAAIAKHAGISATELLWELLLCPVHRNGRGIRIGLVSHDLELAGAPVSLQTAVLSLATEPGDFPDSLESNSGQTND